MTSARSRLALLVSGLLAVLLLSAAPASAQRNIQLGFADDRFADNLLFNENASVRNLWAGRIAGAKAELVRLNIYWSRVASKGQPQNPRNPADPAYDWSEADRAIRAATAKGVQPVLTVLNAPAFAESDGRPPEVRTGTWRPRPRALEEFAEAIARRYSGQFQSGGLLLPRVNYFEAWNEPNLQIYLSPQRAGKRNISPGVYRSMLNGFYRGVKAVGIGSQKVITGGTSPFGETTGTRRMPPVEFWRDVLCLKNRKKLKFDRKACPKPADRAHFDILAHNSISSPGDGPRRKAQLADNATAADMHKLVKALRAAERHGTVMPKRKGRPTWSTELWFESSPPERRKRAASLPKQARFVAESLYLLWKQKVSAGIFLQIRDSPYTPNTPAVIGLQSGVYFVNGKPKPSLAAARFPFVAERRNRKKVQLWGKAPRGGKVVVQRKQGGWKKVTAFKVRANRVFAKKIRLRGKPKLRARIGGKSSLPYRARKR
jgi:hypothetical protein